MHARKVICSAVFFTLTAAFTALCLGAFAAPPPPPGRINYQGVLRDSAGAPLDGLQTMTFRFYDAASAGTVLWEETYSATYPPQVTVSNGLFTLALGDPSHRTAGIEPLFPGIFSNNAPIYLAVAVGLDAEMTPRIYVVSAPYALNSDTLDGIESASFARFAGSGTITANWVNTAFPWADNEVADTITASNYLPLAGGTMTGNLTFSGAQTVDGIDLSAAAPSWDAAYTHSTATSNVHGLTYTAEGTGGGLDSDLLDGQHASAFMASGADNWVNTTGDTMTGKLTTAASTAARAGLTLPHGAAPTTPVNGDLWTTTAGLYGKITGVTTEFLNTSSTHQTKTGSLIVNSGMGYGIDASGPFVGGRFQDSDNSGYAYVGFGDNGIWAYGSTAGGYFHGPGSGYANVGFGDTGIDARGNTQGGYFKDLDNSGWAKAGFGNVGLDAYGSTAGGYFHGPLSGYANAGYGDVGIDAAGNTAGGYFKDLNGSGEAWVGSSEFGIIAAGNYTGGNFADKDSSASANVAYSTYKIQGTGTVSFVQNHPVEKDKVIVYACPEGDEIATYTRGTAKLVNGEARVKLGETFQWVTNPDLGLTVHLTPRGEWADLYTERVSTTELVVRSHGGSPSTAFDYIVYGLRIGFEESSIVQEKQQESYIPSFQDHRERYAKNPELRAFNSLERFKTMESSVSGVELASIDLSRAKALKDAIHEYDPATDPPVEKLFGNDHAQQPPEGVRIPNAPAVSSPQFSLPGSLPSSPSYEEAVHGAGEPASGGAVEPKASLPCFPSSETFESGDVIVLDLSKRGFVRRCAMLADPLVVGIAAGPGEGCKAIQSGEAMSAPARVPVATSGIASCKADASYGPIREGDLLVASPLAGHAMRADSPMSGTVIGKALEPLDAGTGTIQVLVMLR